MATRTVLVVKVAAVGDAVMSLPMLSAIRTAQPGSRVTWLCGRSIRPLLDAVDGIDEILDIDDARLFSSNQRERAAEVLRAWTVLRGRRFDLVIVAHRDKRYRLLTLPVRYGELRMLGEGTRGGPLCSRSHADEYVRLVTCLDDWRATRFPLPRLILPSLSNDHPVVQASEVRPVVALAPGGAKNAARTSPLKRWPLDRYVQLAGALHDRDIAVAIVGDASETWVSEAFHGREVIDLIGQTTLPELLAILARCSAVVAHDSGPFHLATLAGAPTVALFGPTSPDAFVPRDRPVQVLWKGRDLPCAPCYDGREFAACDNNACMQMIEVADVASRLEVLVPRRVADARRAGT